MLNEKRTPDSEGDRVYNGHLLNILKQASSVEVPWSCVWEELDSGGHGTGVMLEAVGVFCIWFMTVII